MPEPAVWTAATVPLTEAGKINTIPLITHRYKPEDIEETYHLLESKLDGVFNFAVTPN